ncbi:hypothetical protein BGZ60DRAFT_494139 [Tricladium varicosporioides]|nr:hypothetical protein BGZ60DRAFT_494139 [Hymenoscyphus varicosporioides]
MTSEHQSGDDTNVSFEGVYIAGKPPKSRWNVSCHHGSVTSVSESHSSTEGKRIPFVAPSLCHPHIHLDKCFLLSHPKYTDLEIKDGDFVEAIELTSIAKSRFEYDDLMERGQALIEESISFGVTHMRAFVEVDESVGMKCVDVGLALKKKFADQCYVQICVFAQDPIVSYADNGKEMKELLEKAVQKRGVEAIGSTPYAEKDGDREAQISNMKFTISLAKSYGLHVDFHIDYHLNPATPSMVLEALDILHNTGWPFEPNSPDRTIVFGHCTRLTMFDESQWISLAEKVKGLPVSFIGLPTSDLFMMGRPNEASGGGERVRGTLQIPQMIKRYSLNGAIGINNVGNAFTPQGSCDPLSLASLGVGIYQAGTKEDADILLECVSTRAKSAIGIWPKSSDLVSEGSTADFVVFSNKLPSGISKARPRMTVQDIIYDAGQGRLTVYQGKVVSHS